MPRRTTGAGLCRWQVRAVPGGFKVFFDGDEWPMTTRPNRTDCERYAARLALRYSDDGARQQIEFFNGKSRRK